MIELSVQDLYLNYGTNPVLKGVSMQLARGEVVSLLGASGSGKTTLLRAIAGLEQASKGRIVMGEHVLFDGAAKTETPAEQRNLGIVFQSYALWPHKTVTENIAYPLKLRKVSAPEQHSRVQEILDQLGMGKLGGRYPNELSGGQQQRVAIGRALVYNPPVLLLDEPLSNLDAKLREEARAFLRELIIRLGLSAIMVTHDQAEAMAISDRILLLNNGRIEQQGTPQEMYAAPQTRFSAEFMGSNNKIEGTLIENAGGRAVLDVFGTRITGQSRTAAAPGGKAAGIIRIERLRCTTADGPNRLKMELKAPMYLGERWELVFARENLTVRGYADAPLPPGDHYVEFPPEALWVF